MALLQYLPAEEVVLDAESLEDDFGHHLCVFGLVLLMLLGPLVDGRCHDRTYGTGPVACEAGGCSNVQMSSEVAKGHDGCVLSGLC